jgi:hypothetical protein
VKRLLTALLLFFPVAALAAVTPNNVITPQLPTRGVVQFLQGTDVAGTYKTLYTAGANGSKCNGIWLTTNDSTATHLITVEVTNAGIRYGGTAITTVLGSGYNGTAFAMDFMSNGAWPGLPTDSEGNPFFFIVSGDTIQATYATALTAATKINLMINCTDF